jgi:class 3 adenylate cyclase
MKVSDVGTWLKGLGLGQFAQAFLDQAIDGEILTDLTEADLQSLGLPLGPRKKILKAIATLRNADESGREEPSRVIPAPPLNLNLSAERRNLTVLICDMVGSMPLATRLDPEELHTVMRSYMDVCTEVITGLGGYVARYLGDGLMAYFGYPRAREDAAEQAVRAGLRLIQAVRCVPATRDISLSTRVGIATGLAVVGDLVGEGAAREEAAVGETPALAARLQSLAPPDGIVIARTTRELIGNMFTLEGMGEQTLESFARPQPAWLVTGEGWAESRYAAVHCHQNGELVGRDSELAILLTRWRLAVSGAGQVVVLSGEPGLGKSRLVEALRESLADQPHDVVLLQCSAYGQTSALRPIAAWIERVARLVPAETIDAKLVKLSAIPGLTNTAREMLAELFFAATQTGNPVIGHEEQRERILVGLTALLTQASLTRPRLLVLEDAQWSDAFTLKLFGRIAGAIKEQPLMLLATTRPEAGMSWAGPAAVTTISLDRLESRDASRIVHRLGAGRLGLELHSRILERAGGVPLFVEELTRSLAECVDAPTAIPATLQDVLMARLDRLQRAKPIAQIAAVLGREFHYEWLVASTGMNHLLLREAIDELVGSGLALVRGTPPDAIYSFKHALVQDAAYQSILRSERVRLHREIARILEIRFPSIAEDQPELIAQHYTSAGEIAPAINWWERASTHAIARAASAEALHHLKTALALLTTLPEDAVRDQREISLRRALLSPLISVGGYGSLESEANLDRLGILLEGAPTNREGLELLYNQSALRLLRSDLARAEEIALRTVRVAQQSGVSNASNLGHRVLAYVALVRGEIAEANRRMTLSARHYEMENLTASSDRPLDSILTVMAQSVMMLLQRGRADDAFSRGTAALNEARRLQLPTTMAYVLTHLGLARIVTRTVDAAHQTLQELIEIVARAEWFRKNAVLLQGWLLAKSGSVTEGLLQMRAGLELAERIHNRLWWPVYILAGAEILIENARFDEARAALDEARRMIAELGQAYALPEMHRQYGVVLEALRAPPSHVHTELKSAVSIARQKGLRLYELRAATSLARFQIRCGLSEAAAAQLAPVVAGFTQGMTLPDLIEARTLMLNLRNHRPGDSFHSASHSTILN